MEWYERAIQMDSRRYVVFIYDLTLYNIILSQPLTRRERAEAFFMELDHARELMEDQWRTAPMQWLDNIEGQFKAGFRCVNDNRRHARRHTCPKTNETDRRGQPLPRNVIGYMSTNN